MHAFYTQPEASIKCDNCWQNRRDLTPSHQRGGRWWGKWNKHTHTATRSLLLIHPNMHRQRTLTYTLMNSSADCIAWGCKLFKCCRTMPLHCQGSWMFFPAVCGCRVPLVWWRGICHLGQQQLEPWWGCGGWFKATGTQGHLIHHTGVARAHWLPNNRHIRRPCPQRNPTYHQLIYGVSTNPNKVSSRQDK